MGTPQKAAAAAWAAADSALKGIRAAAEAADRWKDRYDSVVTQCAQKVDVEVVDGLVAELMDVLRADDAARELLSRLSDVTPNTKRYALLQARAGLDTVMAEVSTAGVWITERYFRRVLERNPALSLPVAVRLDPRRGSKLVGPPV